MLSEAFEEESGPGDDAEDNLPLRLANIDLGSMFASSMGMAMEGVPEGRQKAERRSASGKGAGRKKRSADERRREQVACLRVEVVAQKTRFMRMVVHSESCGDDLLLE